MRHGASLLASLEGMSRPAFRIARELTANSRSGLTVRFLSKKLEVPEEEIEYLLDLNHRLLFTDLTKVKIVSEGHNVVKRIADGLENHGDVPSLMRQIKGLGPHEFRRLEEQLGLDQQITKKMAAEELIERYYRHPDAIVTYVATRGFSDTAREIFDILWLSADGVMPVSQIRIAHGGNEFEVEQGLWELFRGFALFEMFRFDVEDRLVRAAGLLSEIRQWREANQRAGAGKSRLKPHKGEVAQPQSLGLSFSDTLCKLVAAIAARPVRLRGDGDLFREDYRRLAEICPDYADPPLPTCLWVAEGAGWLARVDNTLRAGNLDALIKLDRFSRHCLLYDWMTAKGEEASSRKTMQSLLDEIRTDTWYSAPEFLLHVMLVSAKHEQPILKPAGAHWEYVSPSAASQSESRLMRSIHESMFWLGIVDKALEGHETLFRITPLGEALLRGARTPEVDDRYPARKGEFVVQPNFDIVVPTQDIDPLLTVPLDQFAIRKSTGQATVYNVSKESFTQAVQEGHDSNGFVEFLLAHNRAGHLPTNVMMTLEDWRGAMKRVRLHTIHVLESDDPLILADLMHRRRFSKHFSPIDCRKMVGVADISRDDLTKVLEKDGFIVE